MENPLWNIAWVITKSLLLVACLLLVVGSSCGLGLVVAVTLFETWKVSALVSVFVGAGSAVGVYTGQLGQLHSLAQFLFPVEYATMTIQRQNRQMLRVISDLQDRGVLVSEDDGQDPPAPTADLN